MPALSCAEKKNYQSFRAIMTKNNASTDTPATRTSPPDIENMDRRYCTASSIENRKNLRLGKGKQIPGRKARS